MLAHCTPSLQQIHCLILHPTIFKLYQPPLLVMWVHGVAPVPVGVRRVHSVLLHRLSLG